MTRFLALDVGDRRIGVAVSDATGLIACPLAVIGRASKAEDFRRIADLARQHRAAILVVGLPLNTDDSMGLQALRIERYALALAESLHADGLDLRLKLWDEHASTLQAQAAMIASGRRSRDRRARVDSVAAAVILQDYLDASRRGQPLTSLPAGTSDDDGEH